MAKRPWRVEFFEAFAAAIAQAAQGRFVRILELGSGPGFLAEHLLKALPSIEYVALDFSPAMQSLPHRGSASMLSGFGSLSGTSAKNPGLMG